MEVLYYKVNPTGNVSLIVETPVPREMQPKLAAKLMALDGDSEQVGFIEKPSSPDAVMRLQMMGGEFCGNATLSAAALAKLIEMKGAEGDTVTLEVSGAADPLTVAVKCEGKRKFHCSVDMPLPESCFVAKLRRGDEYLELPVVRFPGISHVIADGVSIEKYGFDSKNVEGLISDWCCQLRSDALGIMFYDENEWLMNPYVYVAATDSAVWENSCASGTTAVASYLCLSDGRDKCLRITQPGGTLSVDACSSHGAISLLKLSGNVEVLARYSVNI